MSKSACCGECHSGDTSEISDLEKGLNLEQESPEGQFWVSPARLLSHGIAMGLSKDGMAALQEGQAAMRREVVKSVIDDLSSTVLHLHRDAGFYFSMTPETAAELQCLAAQGDRKAVTVLCNVRVERDTAL